MRINYCLFFSNLLEPTVHIVKKTQKTTIQTRVTLKSILNWILIRSII